MDTWSRGKRKWTLLRDDPLLSIMVQLSSGFHSAFIDAVTLICVFPINHSSPSTTARPISQLGPPKEGTSLTHNS